MLERSTVSGKGYSGIKAILAPGMDPVPQAGYSFSFEVTSDPMVVMRVADASETDEFGATVQISPDGGVTFTDFIIHGKPVTLNIDNTLVKIPIAGVYRLRTNEVYTTYAIYSVFMTHEQNIPLVDLARPGPQGAKGEKGDTGATGIQGPIGPRGGTGPHFLPTPRDYGAFGDNDHDDGPALQRWLDAIAGSAGFGEPGRYVSAQTLKIRSGTTIFGAGKTAFIIKARKGKADGNNLLSNEILFTAEKQLEDRLNAIAIYDTCFEGDAHQPISMNAGMIHFLDILDLTLRDCLFQHWRWQLVYLQDNTNVIIDACEFTDWGDDQPVPDPIPPEWENGICDYNGGQGILVWQTNNLLKITNCYFHDGHWCAIELPTDSTFHVEILIDNCEFKNIIECGIFGGGTFLTVSNCRIHNITNKACAGSGMEVGGLHLSVIDNCVDSTDAASILLNGATYAICKGNICSNATKSTIGVEPWGIISYRIGGPPFDQQVTIANNILIPNGRTKYGIAFWAGGNPVHEASIIGNNLGISTLYPGGLPLFIDPSVYGNNWIIRDNNGSSTADPVKVQFLIPAGSSGVIPIRGVGFRPRSIDVQAIAPYTFAPTSGSCSMSFGHTGHFVFWHLEGTPPYAEDRGIFYRNSVSIANSPTDCFVFADNLAIALYDSTTATPVCKADIIALVPDGFNLQIIDDPTSVDVLVNAICHP